MMAAFNESAGVLKLILVSRSTPLCRQLKQAQKNFAFPQADASGYTLPPVFTGSLYARFREADYLSSK
jgi:hypothetical protein